VLQRFLAPRPAKRPAKRRTETMNVETHRKRIVSSFIGLEGVPETIRSLSLFAEPDYIDCFVLEVCHDSDNTNDVLCVVFV
jgi:hypothetical protein